MPHFIISVCADYVDKTDKVSINMQQRECGYGETDYSGTEQSGTLLFSTFFFTL